MQLLTPEEAAEFLKVSKATLFRMWAREEICPPIRVSKRFLRWRSTDLEKWATEKEAAGPRVPVTAGGNDD